jgi:hypothetical protein
MIAAMATPRHGNAVRENVEDIWRNSSVTEAGASDRAGRSEDRGDRVSRKMPVFYGFDDAVASRRFGSGKVAAGSVSG